MPNPNRNFRHLNREGLWPDFATLGLEPDADGVLRLEALPRLVGSDADADSLPAPSGVTGVAADALGRVYAVDRSSNVVFRIGDCLDPNGREIILRSGDLAGIAVAPHRNSLFVAEPSAGRIRIVDLESGQTTDFWTGFNHPTALAFDGSGALYVVESGAGRIRKFAPSGIEDPAFAAATAAISPTDVAAVTTAGVTTVYVLDAGARLAYWLTSDGSSAGLSFGRNDLQQPMGLAADETRVFIGDNARRGVLVFRRGPDHILSGEAGGHR